MNLKRIEVLRWYHVTWHPADKPAAEYARTSDVLGMNVDNARKRITVGRSTPITVIGVYRQGTGQEYYDHLGIQVPAELLKDYQKGDYE